MLSHRRHDIHQSPTQLQDQLQISLTFSKPTRATMLSTVRNIRYATSTLATLTGVVHNNCIKLSASVASVKAETVFFQSNFVVL